MQRSFLGTGWGFPVTFQKQPDTGVRMVSEVEDISESLVLLLSTRPGERVMRPDYGCNLEDMLFESVNESLLTYIKDLITKSILYYEPRIQLKKIDILTDRIAEGMVKVEVDFIIRSSNTRFNFVYDYYQREATLRQV